MLQRVEEFKVLLGGKVQHIRIDHHMPFHAESRI
jgi:hypothetical protein